MFKKSMYVCIYIYVCICVYMYIKYIYIISIYKLMHVLALGLFVINRSISSKSQKQGTQSTPILNAKKRDWAMIITQNWSYLGLLRNVFLIGALYTVLLVLPHFCCLKQVLSAFPGYNRRLSLFPGYIYIFHYQMTFLLVSNPEREHDGYQHLPRACPLFSSYLKVIWRLCHAYLMIKSQCLMVKSNSGLFLGRKHQKV